MERLGAGGRRAACARALCDPTARPAAGAAGGGSPAARRPGDRGRLPRTGREPLARGQGARAQERERGMGRGSHQRRKGGGGSGSSHGKGQGPSAAQLTRELGVVPAAAAGCHLSPLAHAGGWLAAPPQPFDADEYDVPKEEIPELAFDPHGRTLSIINVHAAPRAFLVSAFHRCEGRRGRPLAGATTRGDPEAAAAAGGEGGGAQAPEAGGGGSSDGGEQAPVQGGSSDGDGEQCVTFIAQAPPQSITTLCVLADVPHGASYEALRLESDVSTLTPHPNPAGECRAVLRFPLAARVGPRTGGHGRRAGEARFLCTQGFGGSLTHCLSPCTHHAVDFRCAVGTPVVAAADGVVSAVRDSTRGVSGISVRNLFAWNSIAVEIAGGLVTEYVHIRAGSARVKVGDRVSAGDVLCESGDVGFCPEPHLHFQVTEGGGDKAHTVPFQFMGALGAYYPRAGEFYHPTTGAVDPDTGEPL